MRFGLLIPPIGLTATFRLERRFRRFGRAGDSCVLTRILGGGWGENAARGGVAGMCRGTVARCGDASPGKGSCRERRPEEKSVEYCMAAVIYVTRRERGRRQGVERWRGACLLRSG